MFCRCLSSSSYFFIYFRSRGIRGMISDCRTISDERLPLRLPLRLPGGTQPAQPTRSSDGSDGVKSETSQQADAWADLDVFSRTLGSRAAENCSCSMSLKDWFIQCYAMLYHAILCYTSIYFCHVFDIVWVFNVQLVTCLYFCCPAKGVPWLIVYYDSFQCSALRWNHATGSRLLDPVFPLAQLRDGDDCFNMAQQLFARWVSYLRSGSLRKSCLFRFWFRYMRKAQHTHTHCVWKGDREYHRWLPNPLFQDLFQDLPSPNVCLWRSTVLLGFVLDWMPSRQPAGLANQPILTMRNQEFAMVCFKLSNVGKILENPFLSSGHSSPFFRSKHDFAQ